MDSETQKTPCVWKKTPAKLLPGKILQLLSDHKSWPCLWQCKQLSINGVIRWNSFSHRWTAWLFRNRGLPFQPQTEQAMRVLEHTCCWTCLGSPRERCGSRGKGRRQCRCRSNCSWQRSSTGPPACWTSCTAAGSRVSSRQSPSRPGGKSPSTCSGRDIFDQIQKQDQSACQNCMAGGWFLQSLLSSTHVSVPVEFNLVCFNEISQQVDGVFLPVVARPPT